MEAEKEFKYLTFNQIESALHAGIVPSYVFLRDSIGTEYFLETQKLHNQLLQASSEWIAHVKKIMANNLPEEEEEIVEDRPPDDSGQ